MAIKGCGVTPGEKMGGDGRGWASPGDWGCEGGDGWGPHPGGGATPKVFTRMCGLGFQQPTHCGACLRLDYGGLGLV